jgi:hypothetical protein
VLKRDVVEPDRYFGFPLLTQRDEERATEDAYRRINDDDRYRFEPWTATLP